MDISKHSNICIIWVPQERRERGRKTIWRNNGPKLPKFGKNINLYIPEFQWTLSEIKIYLEFVLDTSYWNYWKSNTEGLLKATRAKQLITYKLSSIRLTAISPQKPGKPEDSGLTFKVLEEKAYKPRSLYLAKLSFKNKREIKTFIDKQNGENFSLADLPYKNTKGRPLGWNEKTLDNSFKPQNK